MIDENIRFHLRVTDGQVGKYVILPGDPGRVAKIAERFERAEHIATNREYTTYTGSLDGAAVSAVSTGIGGPSAAIAVEELIKCGCHTFIRVGTCGGINPKVAGGDLVIATAAVRGDGTSKEYLPPDYPAAADFGVVTALARSAGELSTGKGAFHVGVVQSKDSFYSEIQPESMPVSRELISRWNAFIKCGCLASEMEAATIFSVALARGVRAGCVLTALWNVERPEDAPPDGARVNSERAIDCAVRATRALIAADEGVI
ncbi:MAG: uridine phosphorylase [Oscillospiraceae bacterium]|nr:uridine phosphorylase [Oscillospiraceae bacterium]